MLEACGKEHPDTLTSVNNLAVLYQAQGRYGEAEPLYKRALEASERVLGKEHPDTLASVNNLALLYQAQGRYGEAEPLYRRALEASERVLGKEHPDTLTSVNNLAVLYQAQGRYGEAEPLYKRALEASERVLGKEHPDTLIKREQSGGAVFHAARLDPRRAILAAQHRCDRRAHAARRARHRPSRNRKEKKRSGAIELAILGLVKAVHRLVPEGRAPDAKASREMFQTAQWAARLRGGAIARANGGARRHGQSGARGLGARAAGSGGGMAEARWAAQHLARPGPGQTQRQSRSGEPRPACRHRHAHRGDRHDVSRRSFPITPHSPALRR